MLQNTCDEQLTSGNGITWANADSDLNCHMVSQGYSEYCMVKGQITPNNKLLDDYSN